MPERGVKLQIGRSAAALEGRRRGGKCRSRKDWDVLSPDTEKARRDNARRAFRFVKAIRLQKR